MYIDKEYQELTTREFDGIFTLCQLNADISFHRLIHAYYYNRIANHNEQINIKLFYCLRYICKKLLREVCSHNGEHEQENSIYRAIVDISNGLIKNYEKAVCR